jgi:hypothetical protein
MPSHFNKLRTYYVIQIVSSVVSLATAASMGCFGKCRFSMRYSLRARGNGKRANLYVRNFISNFKLPAKLVGTLYLILNQDLFLNVFITL